MTTSIASDGQWRVAMENAAGREPSIRAHAKPGSTKSPPRHILGFLDDAILLILVVLLFPLVILLIGTPAALLVRLLIEIAQRL